MKRIRITQTALLAGLAAGLMQVGAEAFFFQSNNRASQEAARETQQRVPDILQALGIGPGAVVADVGAGQGFFTVRLSKAVGDTGRVLAVDVSPSALQSLRRRVDAEGLRNVQVIEGAIDDPRLPENSLDAALIVNAYHEMTEHQAMLEHIRRALKPTGRLVIVEPISPSRREAARETQTRQHEIAPEYVQRDARGAGFAITGLEDPFSNHHGHGGEYMIVLAPTQKAAPSAPADQTDEVTGDLPAADIRIPVGRFLPLFEQGKVLVLDVRDEASYLRGRIPGAKLTPMNALRDLVPELKKSELPIVTYCSCPAEETSSRAVLYLRKNGVTNVKALVGGYEAWEAAGRKVERGR